MKLILGKQELLILLVDFSASMYWDSQGEAVNKHRQVQHAINALVKRINASQQSNHILISIILFAEKTLIAKLQNDDFFYNFSKDWMSDNKLDTFFNDTCLDHQSLRNKIGKNTSISAAFEAANEMIKYFFSDDNIAPENRKGVSVMLFSDGNENTSDDLFSALEKTKLSMEGILLTKIQNISDKNNLSICTIGIGGDADLLILKSLSTPYTEKQRIHIKRLRESGIEASSRVDPLKCFLKLEANNNQISDVELTILRNFLFLVTNTPV